jgi:hypothetical protein
LNDPNIPPPEETTSGELRHIESMSECYEQLDVGRQRGAKDEGIGVEEFNALNPTEKVGI